MQTSFTLALLAYGVSAYTWDDDSDITTPQIDCTVGDKCWLDGCDSSQYRARYVAPTTDYKSCIEETQNQMDTVDDAVQQIAALRANKLALETAFVNVEFNGGQTLEYPRPDQWSKYGDGSKLRLAKDNAYIAYMDHIDDNFNDEFYTTMHNSYQSSTANNRVTSS